MRVVSQEFGLSNVGLAKLCRRHRIPVPPRGYWRKKETGYKVTQPYLRKSDIGLELVDIFVRERVRPDLAALKAEPPPKIAISGDVSHPLVLGTEKLLTHGTENDRKLIVPKNGIACPVLVSREQVGRALRILNALFLALEERGCSILRRSGNDPGPALDIDGESISFYLQELVDSRRQVQSQVGARHTWDTPIREYRLTGRLQFLVQGVPYRSGIRRTWSDGKQQRLENCVGEIVVGLKVVAAAITRNRQEIEERHRRWGEEQKRREEEKRAAEENKRRVDFIMDLLRRWEEVRRLRSFVRAVERRAAHLGLPGDQEKDVQQVLEWAKEYADLIDPLVELTASATEFLRPQSADRSRTRFIGSAAGDSG